MSAVPPGYPVAARALLRDTLLDAADALMRAGGWDGVTMAQVAAGAGVSRQTLYNEFGDRGGLAQAYVLREATALLAAAERAIDERPGDPAGAIEAAFAAFLDAVEDHPVRRAILAGSGGDGLLELVTTEGDPVLSTASAHLAAHLERSWTQIEPADARLIAETTVRLAISHAALPAGPVASSAAAVGRILAPFVTAAVARAAAAP